MMATTREIRERLLGPDTDRSRERFRFWLRAGLFPGQAPEGKVKKGGDRNFSFEDLLVGRLIVELQTLTQARRYELLKELIGKLRARLASVLRQTKSFDSKTHEEVTSSWVIVSWNGKGYTVTLAFHSEWKDLSGLISVKVGRDKPFIILPLHVFEAEELDWWNGLKK